MRSRKDDGPFESLAELCDRIPPSVLNRRTMESLIHCGALDLIAPDANRAQLIADLDLLIDWAGPHGIQDFRKHTSWYLKGYATGPAARHALHQIKSLDDLKICLNDLDPNLSLDPESLRIPRSHRSGPRKVSLPEGWLDDPDDMTPLPIESEALVSGG